MDNRLGEPMAVRASDGGDRETARSPLGTSSREPRPERDTPVAFEAPRALEQAAPAPVAEWKPTPPQPPPPPPPAPVFDVSDFGSGLMSQDQVARAEESRKVDADRAVKMREEATRRAEERRKSDERRKAREQREDGGGFASGILETPPGGSGPAP